MIRREYLMSFCCFFMHLGWRKFVPTIIYWCSYGIVTNERAVWTIPPLLTNSCCCSHRVRFWFCDGTQKCLEFGIIHRKLVRTCDLSTFRIQNDYARSRKNFYSNQPGRTTLSFFCSLRSCIIDLPRGEQRWSLHSVMLYALYVFSQDIWYVTEYKTAEVSVILTKEGEHQSMFV